MDEPLKISEVIDILNSIKAEHGDIKLGTWSDGILKFIRSVKYIETSDHSNCAAVLQWWEDDDEEDEETE